MIPKLNALTNYDTILHEILKQMPKIVIVTKQPLITSYII
jgi:hypothetical protein